MPVIDGVRDDFERTKEDPVTFLRLRALALAPEMGVPLSYASEAVAIFVTAFGEAWLNDAAEDKSPSLSVPFRRHPLGDLVSTAGAHQIAEAFEVSDYLRALQDSPHLQRVIIDLKAQYRQAILQLAFAARLRAIGANEVELEPPAAAGRFSDILFRYSGTAYRAECYRPTVRSGGARNEELIRLGQDALDAVKVRPLVYSISIALKEEPTAPTRKRLIRVVLGLAERVDQRAGSQAGLPGCTFEDAAGTVSVCQGVATTSGTAPKPIVGPSFPEQEDTWSVFLRQGVSREADVVGVFGEAGQGTGLSSAAIWLPRDSRKAQSLDQDLTEPLVRLGKKVENKISQTRADSQELRVLIVDSWLTGQIRRARPEDVTRLKRKLVDSHEAVAGLLLVQRQWMDSVGRHGYQMHALLPDSQPRLPEDLLQRLSSIDRPRKGGRLGG